MEKLKWIWLIVIAAAVAASIYYHLLLMGRLEQTSALFIGIPALIAVICVLTPKPDSAVGTAVKSLTLFLCIAGALLGEGFICLLMAAPIFYLVAIVIGCVLDRNKKRGHLYSCMVLVFVLPLTIEGTTPTLSFARQEQVVEERIVAASPQQVEAALLTPPRLHSKLPFYLRLGFPRPVNATLSGAQPGDRYVVHFGGGEGKPGDLTLEITDRRPGVLSFMLCLIPVMSRTGSSGKSPAWNGSRWMLRTPACAGPFVTRAYSIRHGISSPGSDTQFASPLNN